MIDLFGAALGSVFWSWGTSSCLTHRLFGLFPWPWYVQPKHVLKSYKGIQHMWRTFLQNYQHITLAKNPWLYIASSSFQFQSVFDILMRDGKPGLVRKGWYEPWGIRRILDGILQNPDTCNIDLEDPLILGRQNFYGIEATTGRVSENQFASEWFGAAFFSSKEHPNGMYSLTASPAFPIFRRFWSSIFNAWRIKHRAPNNTTA